MRNLLVGLLCVWPWLAHSQDWATRAFCDVDLRPVVAEDFLPLDLAALEDQAAKVQNGIGRFWQIESSDGRLSHLWGTYHVSQPEILDLPQAVKDAIANARLAAFELDFTFRDRDAFLNQFDVPGRYRDPSDPFAAQDPLDLSFLGREAEGWLYDRLAGWGATEDDLFVLTYAGLAEILLSDPCEDFTSGVIPVQDDYILTLAHIAGASIKGLEEPMEFLADLSEDEATAKAITQVYAAYLEPPPDQSTRIASFQLYIEGRLGLLSAWDRAAMTRQYGDAGLAALTRTDAYLLDLRNRRFVDRITPDLAAGGVFLAVGAAHLPGENGLVSMLRQDGFDVTRIPLEGEAP